jgi:hypothetical protein
MKGILPYVLIHTTLLQHSEEYFRLGSYSDQSGRGVKYMAKQFFVVLFLTLSLVLSGVVQLSAVSAQGAQDVPYNQTPVNNGQGQTGGTGTTTNDETGFDWRWLLPLLAIPVIFMFGNRSRDDGRSQYRDERYAGTKGGSSKKEQYDDEF